MLVRSCWQKTAQQFRAVVCPVWSRLLPPGEAHPSAIVNDAERPDWRHWLAAARHPARKDGAIAVTLLVLPWVIALVLWLPWLRHHHLDVGTVVTVIFGFAAVSVGLPAVWLAWVPIRNASRSGAPSAGPGSGVSYGPATAAQLVYQQPDVASKPVSLNPRPTLLAGREDLLAGLDTWLSAGDGPRPRIVALYGLGGLGRSCCNSL